MWKIAVLKSNRHVVVVDRFIDHVAEQVARVGRKTVCQALEQFCGEFELTLWDDLASRFDASIRALSQVYVDSVSLLNLFLPWVGNSEHSLSEALHKMSNPL